MRWFVRDSMIITIFLLILMGLAFFLLKRLWFLHLNSCKKFPKIEHYREVKNIFDICDKNVLVTFDVDDTLITAHSPLANFELPLWFELFAVLKYPSLLFDKDRFVIPASIIFQQAERYVFDPDVVAYIKQLRQHGCNVVALTSMESGSFGVIKNAPEWRANMLKQFGIDLQGQFNDVSFTKLPLYRGDCACLYKGILCANMLPKGDVLGAFLEYEQCTPKRIISFDDEACALESIADQCESRGITFTGYQCVGARKVADTLNTRRAFLQLDYLMENARWLSDAEADALLTKETKHA